MYFYLGETRFVIPKKYMRGVSHNYLGIPDSARLVVLLPNFEWKTKQNKHEFDASKTPGWGRRLTIVVEFSRHHYTTDELIKNQHSYVLDRGFLKKEYGLEVYQYEKYYSIFYYIYFNQDGNIPILFRCVMLDVPSPGCTGRYDLNEHVRVEFDFHAKYLPQWKIIWQKLDDLLGSNPNHS